MRLCLSMDPPHANGWGCVISHGIDLVVTSVQPSKQKKSATNKVANSML